MRIIFVGAVEFSRHCLEAVLRNGGEVAGVFTLERKDAARHADYADLAPVASAAGIPVHPVGDLNEPQQVERVRSLRPDILFVFGWSQLVSKRLLAVPPMGAIGAHPALLPRHRGRHPLIWALVEGLTESGLTFFYLDERADSGDLLWQQPFPITLQDDAGSLYEKIKMLADEAIGAFLPQLQQGTASRRPQDHRQASYWRKRGEADGEISWDSATMQSYNLIRALARPYVGAHTYCRGRKVVLWRSELSHGPLAEPARDAAPGMIFARRNGTVSVRTGDGHLTILDWDTPKGTVLEPGVRLGRRE